MIPLAASISGCPSSGESMPVAIRSVTWLTLEGGGTALLFNRSTRGRRYGSTVRSSLNGAVDAPGVDPEDFSQPWGR